MFIKQRLLIAQRDHIYVVTFDSILFCQSDNCYTTVYLVDGNSYILVKSLSLFAREAKSDAFIRVSQSYLVNKDHITSINRRAKNIVLANGHVIPFTVTISKLMALMQ